MIFLLFFLFNFELKAPTTEFINRDGERITIFPLGIELYEGETKILANYAEFKPRERIFYLRDSVKIFINKDTCYTSLAIYNLKSKNWQMPEKFFLIANLKDRGKITILGEKSQYDLEKELLFLEKGEIKLKERVKLFGEKIKIDNKNNFLYSYLETKIMNYDDKGEMVNSLNCDTLFYDFKKDTGLAIGNVTYIDSSGKVAGELASFILQEETIKEATFQKGVFLSFQKEDNKIELECKRVKFTFDKRDLKVAYGEEILLGKTYLKRK